VEDLDVTRTVTSMLIPVFDLLDYLAAARRPRRLLGEGKSTRTA